MRIKSVNVLFVAIAAFLLVGCKENHTYSYFLKHPIALQKAVDQCAQASVDQRDYCQVVASARKTFSAILNQQQEDPEKFGQIVIDTETTCAQRKQQVFDQKKIVQELKSKQASQSELDAAEKKLQQAKNDYSVQREKLAILLAVISVNSPE